MVEELPVEGLLRFDGAPDLVRVELHPDPALGAVLLHVDLLNLAEVRANQLHLVFDVDEEARRLLQVYFLRVKHVQEHNAV